MRAKVSRKLLPSHTFQGYMRTHISWRTQKPETKWLRSEPRHPGVEPFEHFRLGRGLAQGGEVITGDWLGLAALRNDPLRQLAGPVIARLGFLHGGQPFG